MEKISFQMSKLLKRLHMKNISKAFRNLISICLWLFRFIPMDFFVVELNTKFKVTEPEDAITAFSIQALFIQDCDHLVVKKENHSI